MFTYRGNDAHFLSWMTFIVLHSSVSEVNQLASTYSQISCNFFFLNNMRLLQMGVKLSARCLLHPLTHSIFSSEAFLTSISVLHIEQPFSTSHWWAKLCPLVGCEGSGTDTWLKLKITVLVIYKELYPNVWKKSHFNDQLRLNKPHQSRHIIRQREMCFATVSCAVISPYSTLLLFFCHVFDHLFGEVVHEIVCTGNGVWRFTHYHGSAGSSLSYPFSALYANGF